jgi:hypothetical protein
VRRVAVRLIGLPVANLADSKGSIRPLAVFGGGRTEMNMRSGVALAIHKQKQGGSAAACQRAGRFHLGRPARR